MPRGVRVIGAHRATQTAHQLRYERMESRFCDVIVASAVHLRDQLIEGAGVTPGRIVVIPNSIDVERFGSASARGAAVRAQIAPGKRRLLISMGRISHEKRMEKIAEALGVLKRGGVSLADVCVAIIGPSEQADSQRVLDEAIAREELGSIVLQLPGVSEPEAYFAACDASILASPLEGLPVVMLESLAAGKPVVLSKGANGAGVVAAGATGWVAPSNEPADLAAALRQMLAASDDELARMGEHCRAEAGRYAIDTLARRYMALYDALVAASSSRGAADRWAALAAATR